MFCKNCGTQLDDDAKFCHSCGAQAGKKEEKKSYTAPRAFERNSVDESKNFNYQKSAFKGKQVSTGNSGSIRFNKGDKKENKKGFFGKLIKLGIVVVVVVVGASFLLGNNGVYNIETASYISYDTYESIDKTSTFYVDSAEIFVTFSLRDYEIGSIIEAQWVYVDDDILITTQQITTTLDEQNGYFSMTKPTAGWPVGEYEIIFYYEQEQVDYVSFDVE